jgi:hypothetical protein
VAPKVIAFCPEPWTAEAAQLLKRAEAHDTTAGSETVQHIMAAGLPLLAARDEAGELVGAYVVTWNATRRDLHVWAAAGDVRGGDMTAAINADLEHRAHLLGADLISCHTRRGGLVRKLTRAGWGVHGVILRKFVKATQ